MTAVEKKERLDKEKRLRKYLIAVDHLKRKCDDAARWESMSMGPFGMAGIRRGKGQPDTIKETAIQLRQECETLAVSARESRQKLAEALSLMEDDQLRALLESKYIDGQGNRELMKKLNYSERHISRLITRAIWELDRCSTFFS
ncbi:MAG: hypothetical protein LKJ17_07050 [Oscillospiraceae bacterium]|jgi:DNA-directed RNA polymerase specialized sigma24 family protein|nr:hypothetical protein [Oscillospiraceae bacterium]